MPDLVKTYEESFGSLNLLPIQGSGFSLASDSNGASGKPRYQLSNLGSYAPYLPVLGSGPFAPVKQYISLNCSRRNPYHQLFVGWCLHFGAALTIKGVVEYLSGDDLVISRPFRWRDFGGPGFGTGPEDVPTPFAFNPSFSLTRVALGSEFSSAGVGTVGSLVVASNSYDTNQSGANSGYSQAVLVMSPTAFVADITEVRVRVTYADTTNDGTRVALKGCNLQVVAMLQSQSEPF